MTHDDSPETMARMHAWLEKVCTETRVEPEVMSSDEEALLDLIATVAHGPSRPGAPLTMFLLGVAVGRGADTTALIDRLHALASSQADPTGK